MINIVPPTIANVIYTEDCTFSVYNMYPPVKGLLSFSLFASGCYETKLVFQIVKFICPNCMHLPHCTFSVPSPTVIFSPSAPLLPSDQPTWRQSQKKSSNFFPTIIFFELSKSAKKLVQWGRGVQN